MKKFFTHTNSGFSLVELLLYISILALILLSISAFLSTLITSRVKNQTISEVESQGLQAMHLITQTIRNSASITSPAQGASAANISLSTYTVGLNPTVFDVSGGALRISEGGGATVALTNSRVTVSELSFQNVARTNTPGSIRISFTISSVNSSGRNEYQFQKTFVATASLRQP